MKRIFEERLKALEDSLTAQDPVAIVEPVPGGYLLKTGEQKRRDCNDERITPAVRRCDC